MKKGTVVNTENEKIKEHSKAVWGASPAGSSHAKEFQKGTKEFFETVLNKRFSHECNWLDDIVHFKEYKNKKVLEVGSGAGYDAYMFCKHGADYTGIDITPENKILAQKHLAYYNYFPEIKEMDVEQMAFNQEFDFIYSFGVLHHTPNTGKALENIHCALKRKGECLIIVYNKHSIFYWLNLVIYNWILKGNFLKRSLAEQRSLIEYTESNKLPLVNVYSKKRIKKLVIEAGLKIENIVIRKLVVEDIPGTKFFGKFAKYLQRTLNYLAKQFGWYICIRAKKP